MTKKERKRIEQLAKKKGELYKDKNKPKLKMGILHEITISNFEFHIVEMICLINFIQPQKYVFSNEGGTIIEDDFKFNKKFRKLSLIDWDCPTYLDSPAYRAKFLTKLLFWILENDEVIIENIIDVKNPDKPNWVRRGVLKTIMIRLDMFIVNFLARDCNYGNDLYGILEVIGLEKCTNSQDKINKDFLNQSQLVKDYFNNVGDISEPLLWHTILRLAYIMVDGKRNFGDIPKFKDDLDVTNQDEMREVIGRLGIAIIVNENKKRTSPLYKIWESSKGIVTSRFDDISEYPELLAGTKALHFLAFILDIDEFTSYIKETI